MRQKDSRQTIGRAHPICPFQMCADCFARMDTAPQKCEILHNTNFPDGRSCPFYKQDINEETKG